MTGRTWRLVITDSGLGGLSICADIEGKLRSSGNPRDVQIVYFNAWPREGTGYNDLPDMAARSAAFEPALRRMAGLQPDLILIACNTLSVVYPFTGFSRTAAVPVLGIIDSGTGLFRRALAAEPTSAIVLLGTRTTIQSGAHRTRLIEDGISASRITGVVCHGLAAAIESDPAGPAVASLIEQCAEQAAASRLLGERIYAGLCCTHYTFVAEKIRVALERSFRRPVTTLDPNGSLADSVVSAAPVSPQERGIAVQVLSKVALDDGKRRTMAGIIAPVSGVTARALLSYTHAPELF